MAVTTTYPDCCCPSSGTITVSCCGNLLPAVLLATVTGATGDCTCLLASFSITWDGVSRWRSSVGSLCSGHTFNLGCPSGADVTHFNADFDTDLVGTLNTLTASCDPLNLSFAFTGLGVPCTGSFTVTVTVPP